MIAYEPYWQTDLSLGAGVFSHKTYPIRMLLHVVTDDPVTSQEIVPLPHPPGMRTVVRACPYIRRSRSWLGTLLHRVLPGRVPDSLFQELGDCKAWYYHEHRLLILWNCYLAERTDPRTDQNLASVWSGFESLLCALFPDTAQIATPSWERAYERADWQAFLRRRGYAPFSHKAFLKKVGTPEPRLRQ